MKQQTSRSKASHIEASTRSVSRNVEDLPEECLEANNVSYGTSLVLGLLLLFIVTKLPR